MRPTSMNGGDGSYDGFSIPATMESNDNAAYSCEATTDEVTFTAVSADDLSNKIIAEIGTDGRFIQSAWSYPGAFL